MRMPNFLHRHIAYPHLKRANQQTQQSSTWLDNLNPKLKFGMAKNPHHVPLKWFTVLCKCPVQIVHNQEKLRRITKLSFIMRKRVSWSLFIVSVLLHIDWWHVRVFKQWILAHPFHNTDFEIWPFPQDWRKLEQPSVYTLSIHSTLISSSSRDCSCNYHMKHHTFHAFFWASKCRM